MKKPKKIKKGTVTRSPKSLDEKYMGSEPDWELGHVASDIDIMTSLNWYHHFYGPDDSKQWFIEYLSSLNKPKKEIISIKTINKFEFHSSYGFLGRMAFRGCILPDDTQKKISREIDRLLSVAIITKPSEVVNKKRPNIQEHIHKQVSTFVGELEYEIDVVIDSNFKKEFDAYFWLQKNEVKSLHASKLILKLQPDFNEINSALEKGGDAEIKEAYSCWKPSQLKKLRALYTKVISDCEKWANVARKTRTPRKKKPISVEKLLTNIKYKKEDNEYKIASVNPSEIIGAEQLWVFNTKTRKLGVYHTNTHAGLTIKGTTLKNYEPMNSICKTLRKPDEVLVRVLEGGKIVLRKVLDEINAKHSEMNGRLNNETILLRVVK
tara:strand:- start:4155 stop:5291 length:1137 start_codon:yes stop_codon:yes gene_type:complete